MPAPADEGPHRSEARLLAEYLRPERRRVFALVGILVVAMLLPVAGPVLIGRFIDDAQAQEPVGTLLWVAAGFIVLALAADGLQLVVTWLSVRLAWRVGNQLRSDLNHHALRLELAWHGEHSPGLLIERIDGDIEALTTFSSTAVLQLLGNAVLLTGVFVVSVVIDWRAGLLIGLSTAVAAVLMIRLRGAAVPANDHEREVLGQLYGDLEERLGGLEDLRANGAGAYAVHRLHEHSARWWRAARRASLIGDGAYVAAGSAFSIGSVLTLALAVLLYRRGEVSLGAVLALFRFSQMIREPLERIAEQMREFQKASAGIRRAHRLLTTEETIVDGAGTPMPTGPLALDLDHVDFAYQPGHPVLHDVDLHLAPGEVLGIVGRTGSGKTTIGRLLLRFWDVSGGAVRLGGVDVRDATVDDLRARVGVVTQEVELFRASVRDNLTMLGAVDVSDATLLATIDEVGLGPWLAGQEDGLDTELHGSDTLSAGEAQLLAFARVFLADPGVVVLDEASSRLDPATEERVTAAIDRLLAGRTVVIIAHRLVTLDRADTIVVLDHGHTAELGPRTTLAADPTSRFARLLAAGTTDATDAEPDPLAAGVGPTGSGR